MDEVSLTERIERLRSTTLPENTYWDDLIGLVLMLAMLLILRNSITGWMRRRSEREETDRIEQEARQAIQSRRETEAHESSQLAAEVRGKVAELSGEPTGPSSEDRPEWRAYVDRPVPPDIQRSMRAFLAGDFVGADRSPLAYVGYRVGESGLSTPDRHRRLEVCFRIEIPPDLDAKYRAWGSPASRTRLDSMVNHLRRLADFRRSRLNYAVAVDEWDKDAKWLRSELGPVANRLSARLTPSRTGGRNAARRGAKGAPQQ